MKTRTTKLLLFACIPFLLNIVLPTFLTIESRILDALVYGTRHLTASPEPTDLMVTFEPTFEDNGTVKELEKIIQNEPKMVLVDFPLLSNEYDSLVKLMENEDYNSPIIFSYHSQMPKWERNEILSKANNRNILVGNVDIYNDRYILNSPHSKPIQVVAAELLNNELSLPKHIYLLTHLTTESFQPLNIEIVEQVTDKVVLYGDVHDPEDQFLTFQGTQSGLVIIGNLISNILNGTYLKTNSMIDGLLASLIFMIVFHLGNWKGFLIATIAGIVLTAIVLFFMNFLVNLTLILLSVLLTYLAARTLELRKTAR